MTAVPDKQYKRKDQKDKKQRLMKFLPAFLLLFLLLFSYEEKVHPEETLPFDIRQTIPVNNTEQIQHITILELEIPF